MKKNHIAPLPLEFLVTYSNHRSILQNPSKSQEIYDRVCKGGKLVFKVEDYQTCHQKEYMSLKELKKLTKLLIKSHEPKRATISKYNISPSEIIPGIICPDCDHFHMERISRSWYCPHCGMTSPNAHEQAILDYFLLIDSTISNKRLRNFLLMPSRSVATNLLGNMNLQYTGTTKNRVYFQI